MGKMEGFLFEAKMKALKIKAGSEDKFLNKLVDCFRDKEELETVLDKLLQRGMDINMQDETGLTVLMHEIINNGKDDIVRLLIDEGANVNIQDKYDTTALHYAVNNYGICYKLAKHIKDGVAYQCHATNDYYSSMESEYNNTMRKVKYYDDIVRVLIDRGANVNIQDLNGETALMRASRYGCNDMAKLLIDKGANVNIQDNNGKTALMYASRHGRNDTAKLLIDKGADVNIQDKDGKTPLMHGIECGKDSEVIKLLIDNGANINIQDEDGKTPLMYTVINKINKKMVRDLIEQGADVNIEDKVGNTVMDYAKEYADKEIRELLYETGPIRIIVEGNTKYNKQKDNRLDITII